ncbi:MAG: sigma-54 dependent transcriptional regulator [Gammaproteobacteria bacterium]|nr:sigma-54 dependent transcriptional regulator [Gammaproteobacteria bacterium]MDH5651484.1 sigma-54 dependent transcriptional regulator [Gammaproteobacteria bacterium]
MTANAHKISTTLIVDDEPDIRELLEITLSRMGIETTSAADLNEARRHLEKQHFDLCLTDMRLPDGSGIELVREIQALHANLPVAVITAHGNMELAIEALKAGAFDFVSKPVDLNILRNLVETALKVTDTSQPKTDTTSGLLGDSDSINETRKTIEKLARSQAPVYISGESGTGKELVAQLIHAQGPRSDKPFVPVNCGAIPTELMESEFFGHKKGSFTGAVSDKQGLFQAADGGTLFLDEVADLPLSMQVKLLRAIQEKAIRPIGAQKETPIDVRILSATHKNLEQLTEEGHFRQDLFYRINVISLHVPSLRERPEDIPVLTRHFLDKIAADWKSQPPAISPEAIHALQHYNFPGNVRELENILERAMTLCESDTVQVSDLQLTVARPAAAKPVVKPAANEETAEDSVVIKLEPMLENKEREVIEKALQKTRYNKTAAAKLLGISFRALRYRIKKLGID